MDSDGYGYRADERGVERVLTDLRTFSPASIERVAGGWDRYEAAGHDALHEADRRALRALETADLAPKWEDVRREVLDLTEGRSSLVSWRAEHGETGHKAERAVLAAALALVAASHLDPQVYPTLVRPAAEALPWLLTP